MDCQYESGEVDIPFDDEWGFDVNDGFNEGAHWWRSEIERCELCEIENDELLDGELSSNELCEMEEVLGESDKKFVEHLRRVESLVKGVGAGKESHFWAVNGRDGSLKISRSMHGKELLKLMRGGCEQRCYINSVVDQNPFVGVFHRVQGKWGKDIAELIRFGLLGGDVNQTVHFLNRIVEDLRNELSRPVIQSFEKRVDRSARARLRRAVDIIDKCFERRSRLLVIRADLGYRKGRFVDSSDFSNDLEMVKRHWAELSADIKKGLVLPSVMEVFAKLEYGVLSGFHYHVVVVMSGAEHQEDISYARMLGQYWSQVVVGKDGRYFNCNRIKFRYKHLGIGEINYYEKEKVSALKKRVIGYVTKSDYYMNALSPAKKTFFQLSCMKHMGGANRGRPRRYLLQND